ncbi:MAG: hypothetical protein RMI01_07600 [Thermodesulfovibrio sp.]|nr:hypothetical protein [Thermodesulfovibrio sp.]
MEEKGYKPYTYQIEAVLQALANCKAHGGTLIADVVGLGKTIIACMTAKALGKRGMVICPPHLMGDEDRKSGWRKYLEDFKLWDWETQSVGKLEEALEFVRDNEDIEVIIVDEALRFRNERTESYHNLREICRGKTVLLLTDTSFNNRPADLFSIIKLFTLPKKSTIILDENLETRSAYYEVQFRKLAYIKNYWNSKDKKRRERAKRYYRELFASYIVEMDMVKKRAKRLAKEMRAILEPVVIRRNRLDLRHYPEKIDFPKVKDPVKWFFELTSFNLNRAGAVISYDISWNPVRVIQRVGRINRIAKKVYPEIYIVNFFPTEKGADIVRSREIAGTKMFMIHNVLGEDSKIFAPDEEPQASELYRRLTTYVEDEEESFFTKIKNMRR